MKKIFYYENHPVRRVLIVGFGISGQSVLSYLQAYQLNCEIYDRVKAVADYSCYTRWDEVNLNRYDLIVLSPGVPVNQPGFQNLKLYQDKVVSDIELFICHVRRMYIERKKAVKIVAVSGSNGKSTVVSLLHHVLQSHGVSSALGGNIGIPALSMLVKQAAVYILELSSFQIDLLKKTTFDVVGILNICQDHLDRYPSFEAYTQSKLALLNYAGTAVLNQRLHKVVSGFENTCHNRIWFNSERDYIQNNYVIVDNEIFLDASDIKLQGHHQLENVLAVACLLKAIGFNPRDFRHHFNLFSALAHRCKFVAEMNAVRYFNDSKATNIGAVIASVQGITSAKNVILLLGGVAKNADFCQLRTVLKQYVRFVCIYGQDRDTIQKSVEAFVNCASVLCLGDAFKLAVQKATEGEIVLLAPGCASFDEFCGFAERGEYFEKLVRQLQS